MTGAQGILGRSARAAWRSVVYVYPIAIVVAIWGVASVSGWTRPMFLPSPLAVLAQGWQLLLDNEVLGPMGVSLYRALAGLVLAFVVGAPLGLLMAQSRWVRRAVDPLIAIAFPAPKITFMPIFILWFGIDSSSKILLVAFTCIFPIIVAAYEGAIATPTVMLWSARAMGTGRLRMIRRVLLPCAIPLIFSGVRVAVPTALITAYTAEMVAGGGGLGSTLMYAQRFFSTPTVFVCIVLMLLSGIVLDRVMLALRNRLIPWLAEEEEG
jgi:ABC-type nitrate/sulfonate/bicarbonate transport system permease component